MRNNFQQKGRDSAPGQFKNQQLNHSHAPRRTQPPFAKSALERLPRFFCPVVYLGDWNAAFADPRPTALIPENADVLDYDWSKIFKATPKREGHKIVIVERGRVSEDRAKSVRMSLLAIGFSRVIVSADGRFLEDGCPLKVYGVQP
jgi:hypothetical protein